MVKCEMGDRILLGSYVDGERLVLLVREVARGGNFVRYGGSGRGSINDC